MGSHTLIVVPTPMSDGSMQFAELAYLQELARRTETFQEGPPVGTHPQGVRIRLARFFDVVRQPLPVAAASNSRNGGTVCDRRGGALFGTDHQAAPGGRLPPPSGRRG
jgi:hypothetical protein